jgi:uncharacterized protein (TIGR02996 family)
MTDEAFLRDILANPGDDTPRLVYADWLEDHGEHDRAELIRVECAREKLPDFVPEYNRLDRRSRELRKTHEEEWFGPLLPLVEEFGTRRGFVEEVTLRASRFVKNAKTILALAPVRELFLINAKGQAKALAGCPQMARIERLGFYEMSALLDAPAARALVKSPYLTGLRELDLGSARIGVSGFKALMAARTLPRLEGLDLFGNGVGNGMLAFLPGSKLTTLKSLNLASNGVNDHCVPGLARNSSLSALEELCLYHNHLTAVGVRALAPWPQMRKLTTFNIHSNPLGDEGVEALAQAPLEAVRDLNLGAVGVGAAGLRALADAPLPNLADLSLRDNRLGPEGAEALAKAPWLAHMDSLDLTGGAIGPAGLRRLLDADFRPASLWLDDSGLDDDSVVELARSPVLSRVTFLTLSSNALNPRGGAALAASPYLDHLVRLWLPRGAGAGGQRQALGERFGSECCDFN